MEGVYWKYIKTNYLAYYENKFNFYCIYDSKSNLENQYEIEKDSKGDVKIKLREDII